MANTRQVVQAYTLLLMSIIAVVYGMNAKPCQKSARRGVIGIESAIVLIAFVMVAAALSFVILNMGFSTTQKAKTTIASGLDESSSAMEITGGMLGNGNVTANRLAYTSRKIVATVVDSERVEDVVDAMRGALGGQSGGVLVISPIDDIVHV